MTATKKMQDIALELLDPSPKNPRKVFKGVDELAASIEEFGVLEPLLVRPFGDRYEIVAGERRRRAAKKAKLELVPCIVRDLDEKTARSIMMHENLDREDLNPIEEADGYAELMKDFGYSVEQLAVEFGRKPRTIYAAIQLRNLGPEARQALFDGKLTASVGLLIARIPGEDLQKKAVEDLCSGDEAISYRVAQDTIQRNFMLPLERAEFDLTDEQLVPAAGSCNKCPKRTGNQRELFADIKSADVCTDPACFRSKVDALVELKFKNAEEEGRKVLRGNQAKKLFGKFGRLNEKSGFVLASGGYQTVPGRGFVDVTKLVKEVPASERVLVQEPDGKCIELVPVKALPKPKAKKDLAQRVKKAETPAQKEKRLAEEKEREEKEARANKVVADLVARAEEKLEKAALVLIAMRLCEEADVLGIVARRSGKDLEDVSYSARSKFERSFSKMSEAELRGVIFELSLFDDFTGTDPKTGMRKSVLDAAKALGVPIVIVHHTKKAAKGRSYQYRLEKQCAVVGCGRPKEKSGFCLDHDAKLSGPERKSILDRHKKLAAEGLSPK